MNMLYSIMFSSTIIFCSSYCYRTIGVTEGHMLVRPVLEYQLRQEVSSVP